MVLFGKSLRTLLIAQVLLFSIQAAAVVHAEDDVVPLLKKAAAKMKAKQYKSALNLYLDAIEMDRDDWRSYQGAGNAYRKMNNLERALEYYEAALELKGEDEKLEDKIDELRDVLEEEEEEEEDTGKLKAIRGAERSALAVSTRHAPKRISAKGGFFMIGYGFGFPPLGDLRDAAKETLGEDNVTVIPFGINIDVQYARVGGKESKLGFRVEGAWALGLGFDAFEDQDIANVLSADRSWSANVFQTSFAADALYRVGKNVFLFGGLAYHSTKLVLNVDQYYNDLTDGLPAAVNYDGTITGKASGIAPRIGFVVYTPFKNKSISLAAEFMYSIAGVKIIEAEGEFDGKGNPGDGDYVIGLTSGGALAFVKGTSLPGSYEELKVSMGGLWMKVGLGVNFGRTPKKTGDKPDE